MVVNVSVVYPCDHEVDWELWLSATAQNHILLAWEKITIQNSKYDRTIIKLEGHKSNHDKPEPSTILLFSSVLLI